VSALSGNKGEVWEYNSLADTWNDTGQAIPFYNGRDLSDTVAVSDSTHGVIIYVTSKGLAGSGQVWLYKAARGSSDAVDMRASPPPSLNNSEHTTASTVVTVATSNPDASVDTDFQARCNAAGVIRCIGFDSPDDVKGTWGSNYGILPGATTPVLDTAVKASGSSSLKFTIPPNSGADTSGAYFTNFSKDLSAEFGENSDFYVQWRQRFSPEILNTSYKGGEGWKQVIIGTGDQLHQLYASCTALEVVTLNSYQRGFPEMYNSCTGSGSHGPYDPFQSRFGSYDFKLQNARPTPFCLYSQGRTNPASYFPKKGNCFGYFANEWMTFQVHIKTGPRVKNEFSDSRVQLWVAREGQPSQLVIDWGPYNLSAGDPSENQKYGKVWLLPYNTNKDSSVPYPVAYTWYDELIISRQKISDPK
jgi:hypothetical protein